MLARSGVDRAPHAFFGGYCASVYAIFAHALPIERALLYGTRAAHQRCVTFVRRAEANNIPPYPITLNKSAPIAPITPIAPSTDSTPSSSPRGSFAPKYNGITGAKPRPDATIGVKATGETSKSLASDPNFQKLSPTMRAAFIERMEK